jgi:hypothetical protein
MAFIVSAGAGECKQKVLPHFAQKANCAQWNSCLQGLALASVRHLCYGAFLCP